MLRRALGSLVILIVGSIPALAQSSIAGVVKDSSGGVLPGVNVEASSSSLIEKTKSVTTDATGQYKIVELRPGTYTVTFTLDGFNTIRREGIELPAAFTATVNVEMRVGALEETVTVTGETPVVDVQGSVSQSVMDRKVLDAIPSGRDVFAIGQLIPGVTTAAPDVGGSEGMQQPTFQVHGSSTRDMVYQQDGMSINNNFGTGNQTGYYYNDGAIEEISYQTSALPAEVSLGGVRINMISRQGGNEFHGAIFATAANSSMQSDNQSDELLARGLRVPNSLKSVYDINASIGGPVKRDRLWFFGSFRQWAANRYVANTFNRDGSQALDDNRLTDGTVRVTVLPSQMNKIALSYGRNSKWRGHRRDNQPATFVLPEAAMVQTTPYDYILQAKWTSTLTNSLMFEAGLSFLKGSFLTGYRPETGPDDVTKYDFGTDVLFNAPIYNSWSNNDTKAYVASLSYVTGQHNLKMGVQIRNGPYWRPTTKNGDILLRFNNGVADSVDLFNTPVTPAKQNLDADHGFYIQDSWTLKRLTLNPGVRFEYFKSSVPAQTAPAGTWVGERSYPEIPVNTWKTVVPRFGMSYDLFGTGKTALKASASKYVQGEGVSLAQLINPLYLTSQRCAWRDSNGDAEAQPNEISSCQGWGGGINTRIDPDLKRPYQWEFVAQVQHELMSRFSASVAYYHRRIEEQYGIRNLLVPPEAYTPVTIANPLDGSPLTIYNQSPETRGRVDNFLTNQDDLWSNYHGFELKLEKRFANGGMILGGFTAGRNRGSIRGSSTDLNNPNNLINHIGAVGYDSTYQANVAGSWMLPFGLQWSGSFRTATGLPLRRVYTVTRAIVPNLTQVNQSIDVLPAGEVRLQNNNLLDMRIAKLVKLRRLQLEAIADVYNVLNSNATTGEVTTIGSSLGRPSAILDGRLLRLGVQMKF
jgi:hypothetical protein